MNERDLILDFARKERARRRLIDFCEYVDPRYQRAPHLELLAEHLERLERREIRKLAISMPPRHGKTETISRKFVAWYLGRHPEHHVILASYGAELAESNSRAVRSIVSDDRYPFAKVSLREDSRSVGRWQTQAGGVLVAVGVGGSLTGFGGDLIVCDDLVKDRAEAESAAIRASTSSWFADVLRTRAHPNAAMVLVGTRWHEDDIIGEVTQNDEGWTELVLPLIAEDENDALGRKPGEMLWPARFSADDIPSVERGQISSRSFAALYQQRPVPMAGGMFKAAWCEHRYDIAPRGWAVKYVMAIDCASKIAVSNDFSAIVVVAFDDRNVWIVDVVRRRMEFPDLVRQVVETYQRWSPRVAYIEGASAGIPLVQSLRRDTGLNVVEVPPRGSKIARAESMTGAFEAGRVLLPRAASPWIGPLVDELVSFPNGKHDDQVDALALAISQAQDYVEQLYTPQMPIFSTSR